MTSELPGWTAFEPGMAPTLPVIPGQAGRVVALVALEHAERSEWAGKVAAGLALAWSAGGHRVVLADAGLAGATLHTALGLANGEGLSDAILWGASVRRVARPVDGGYFLVTAGTAVADAASALAGGRWAELCAGFREAGATLAVFLPTSEGGKSAVLAEASDVVVLATEEDEFHGWRTWHDDPVFGLGGAAARVRAVVGIASPPLEVPESVPDPVVAEPEPLPEPVMELPEIIPVAAPEPVVELPEALPVAAARVEELVVAAPPVEEPMIAPPLVEVMPPAPRAAKPPPAEPVAPPAPADPRQGAWAPTPRREEPLTATPASGDALGAPLPKWAEAAEALRGSDPAHAGARKFDEVAKGFPPVPADEPSGRRRLVISVVVLIVLVVVLAARFGLITIPGITPTGG